MIGKNIEKKERAQGWPVGRSMGPPGNGSYLLPLLVYIIIIYNTSISLAVALFSHYILLYRYISCVYVYERARDIIHDRRTLIFLYIYIRMCEHDPIRPCVYIVLNDVSQHGFVYNIRRATTLPPYRYIVY